MSDSSQTQFASVFTEHRSIIYKVCNAYCRDRHDRDDLAQEIAVQLWRSFERFDGRAAFATWMYRVALNVAISFQRREIRRSQPLVASDERLLNVAAAERDEPEDVRRLYDFIDALGPLDRALMVLYLEEYRYREIAEITGLTETNVATKLSRLKLRLQQHFSTARAASRKRQ